MMWVASDPRNELRFIDLFNLMLAQMGYKQLSSNLIEYFQPIILTKYKIDRHNEDFKEVIEEYEEASGTKNKIIEEKLSRLN